MTIHVRNLRIPDVVYPNGGSALLIYMRELLLLAKWTEQSNDGDTAWPDAGSPNLIATATDLQVDPLSPRVVTSSSSPFTSAMVGDTLTLFAANDQNRSIWRITAYIDANNIEVDVLGFTPFNWVLESGITGRVVNLTSALTPVTAQCLMNAPAPNNMQARIAHEGYTIQSFYVRPKGQVPLATETATISTDDRDDLKHVMHMIAQDENALIWWSTEDTNFKFVMWGGLIDADTADTDPNFILAAFGTGIRLGSYSMRMLDGADADIAVYPTMPKVDWAKSASQNFFAYFTSRQANNGKALLRSPWVCLADVATVGACVRGRIPLLAQTYEGYERFRPLDAAGAWLHTYDGVAVPRNGPDDQLPIIPA